MLHQVLTNIEWNVSFTAIVYFNVVLTQWNVYELSQCWNDSKVHYFIVWFNKIEMSILEFYQIQCSNGKLIQFDWNCSFSNSMLHQNCNWNEECWMESKVHYYHLIQHWYLIQ
jgi:hypothetical protein